MSIEQDFQNAQLTVKTLPSQSSENLLKLYALFKQATTGDSTNGKKPGMMDFVGKAKYDAWAGFTGMSKEAAMQEYTNFVAQLAKEAGK